MSTISFISTLTCPACGFNSQETMPENACAWFYICKGCGKRLKPTPGDCCVFCSYGDVPCPPKQQDAPTYVKDTPKHETASLRPITLQDEAPLKEAFNKERDKTRLILLVSPT